MSSHLKDSSSPSSVNYTEAWLPGYDGLKFYTRTYPAVPVSASASATPRGALIFVHGFAEHIGRYEYVHPQWAARGFLVFTYDQRGYGRTALDKENRSPEGSWSKTSAKEQFADIEWFVRWVREQVGESVPLFLMGQSMGGALALAFASRAAPPPSEETVKLLSGVIASSSFLVLTNPPPKFVVWIGGKVAQLLPHVLIPAAVSPNHLSRDPEVGRKAEQDPLVPKQQKSTLRQAYDFMTTGLQFLKEDYKRWPKDLPVLLLHGTDDEVTYWKATEEVYQKLDATDKKFVSYPGGFHELHHEPDGMADNFINEAITWAEARLPPAAV